MHENHPNITNFMQQISIARKENLQSAYIQELEIVHWYAERWGQWATIPREKRTIETQSGRVIITILLDSIITFP